MNTTNSMVALSWIRKLIPVLFVGWFVSCASQPKTTNSSSIEDVVVSKIGKSFLLTENENKTFVLYQQKPEGDHAAKNYKYLVIRKSDNVIMISGSYQLGYVKWVSNKAIEVLSLPSVIEQDEAKFKKVIIVDRESN